MARSKRAANKAWTEKVRRQAKRSASTLPKYEVTAFRSAEEVARLYDEYADFHQRLALDAVAFNEQRRREGKTIVPAVKREANREKSLATRARAAAERFRAKARPS